VINVIAAIPDGMRNPTAFAGNLVGQLLGGSDARGGWTDEFTKSPINAIVVRGTAGGGKVQVPHAFVESPAFQASATGEMTLASVLTNSTLQFPVRISLRRGLADQLGLTPADTPTNAIYARIPDFVTVRGPLGNPDFKRDYLVLAQVALKAGAGVAGRSGGAALAAGILETGKSVGGQPAFRTVRPGFKPMRQDRPHEPARRSTLGTCSTR
jgi:hypothetical protein